MIVVRTCTGHLTVQDYYECRSSDNSPESIIKIKQLMSVCQAKTHSLMFSFQIFFFALFLICIFPCTISYVIVFHIPQMCKLPHTTLTLTSCNTGVFALCSGETGFRHERDHIRLAECREACQSLQSQPRGKERRDTHSIMCAYSHTDHSLCPTGHVSKISILVFLFVTFSQAEKVKTSE